MCVPNSNSAKWKTTTLQDDLEHKPWKPMPEFITTDCLSMWVFKSRMVPEETTTLQANFEHIP